MTFTRQGDDWVANFANRQLPALKGLLKGQELMLKYDEGARHASSTIKLDDSGRSFSGPYKFCEGQRNFVDSKWEGWRPDPDARKGQPGQFSGLWLTTQGLMEIEQTGDKIQGQICAVRPGEDRGDDRRPRARFPLHLAAQWRGLVRPEQGRQDARGRGRRRRCQLLVRAQGPQGVGVRPPRAAQGRPDRRWIHQEPAHVQRCAPEGFKAGDARRWPTIVILHGSNMSGKAYVNSIAQAWPDIAKDYLILGLNGEVPSDLGDDPRFNFTYVNFMGRSTYKGFPGRTARAPRWCPRPSMNRRRSTRSSTTSSAATHRGATSPTS